MDSSDKSRRTLSEALRNGKLAEEAFAFVTGTGPGPSQPPVSTTNHPVSGQVPPPSLPPSTNPAPWDLHHNAMTPLTVPQHPVVTPAIVSVTFRLPASLTARLARVSAERKLRRERPFHQQDIVAEALAQWLRQHGVLD